MEKLKITDYSTAYLFSKLVPTNDSTELIGVNHYAIRGRNRQHKYVRIDQSYREGDLFTFPEEYDMDCSDSSPVLYEDRIEAPTQEELRAFFRNQYNIDIHINSHQYELNDKEYYVEIRFWNEELPNHLKLKTIFNNYEMALETALDQILKHLLKNN